MTSNAIFGKTRFTFGLLMDEQACIPIRLMRKFADTTSRVDAHDLRLVNLVCHCKRNGAALTGGIFWAYSVQNNTAM